MKLKGMQEASLQYGVKMASYFGKIRNSKTFKPSLELICAILNYVFLNASCTLDSYRADPFQALKPTNLSVYKLKKKQEEMQKIIMNKDIAPAFLAFSFKLSYYNKYKSYLRYV